VRTHICESNEPVQMSHSEEGSTFGVNRVTCDLVGVHGVAVPGYGNSLALL
jgi:hypothetical protein